MGQCLECITGTKSKTESKESIGKQKHGTVEDRKTQDVCTTGATKEDPRLKYVPNDTNVSRLPIKERPSQLKLARGPPVKIKVNTKRIMASIQEKITLRQEVSKFGRLNSSAGPGKPSSGASKSSLISTGAPLGRPPSCVMALGSKSNLSIASNSKNESKSIFDEV